MPRYALRVRRPGKRADPSSEAMPPIKVLAAGSCSTRERPTERLAAARSTMRSTLSDAVPTFHRCRVLVAWTKPQAGWAG
jgi:hypothetical protein